MKKVILSIVLIFSFSCNKKNEGERYVKCSVFFKIDDHGNRVNGFWDLERKQEVSASECNEVVAAVR